MRKYFLLLFGVLLSMFACSQENRTTSTASEFKTYSKGLIYSDVIMGKLEHIVDSLNLKYKTCELNKTFYAKHQTIGHYFSLDTGNIKQAMKDLERNISFEDFLAKYPQVELKKDILIIKSKYPDDEAGEIIEFAEINLSDGYGFEYNETNNPELYTKNMSKTWLFTYYDKETYSKESLSGFYFPHDFFTGPIKDHYARMIGYADCLIDTTTLKFKEETTDGSYALLENLADLSHEAKAELLDKMRSTRVIGFCSQDNGPRIHAMNIAILSAETTNWEVFLKAHLDIMNDRFERASDGSYAWAKRKTYIRELEELDINVEDLILGITLRMDNPASNHYYGSIGRLGRALAELQNKDQIKQGMMAMIRDSELDDYNRVLAYFLFLSYTHFIENKIEKKRNFKDLKLAINDLPDYLREKITLKEN